MSYVPFCAGGSFLLGWSLSSAGLDLLTERPLRAVVHIAIAAFVGLVCLPTLPEGGHA